MMSVLLENIRQWILQINMKNLVTYVIIFELLLFVLFFMHRLLLKRVIEFKKLQLKKQLSNINKTLYEDLASYNHDFKSFLFELDNLLREKNFDKINELIKSDMYIDKELMLTNAKIIEEIEKVEHGGIRNLLFNKLLESVGGGIRLEICIQQGIIMEGINTVLYAEIIGILLDNAIEAVNSSIQREIHLRINSDENGFEFILKNSYDPKKMKSDKKNILSSKGRFRGLGLNIIRNILNNSKNIELNTVIDENFFMQHLVIHY